MIQISKSSLEQILNCKIENDIVCLGVDTASRTGWAILRTSEHMVTIDYGWIDIDTTNHNFKFDRMIQIFNELISKHRPNKIVIEDTFMRFNVNVVKLLSRLGMIVYVMGRLIGSNTKQYFVGPSKARCNIGLNGTCKKEQVHKEFIQKFGVDLKDEDIIDAVILSMNGVSEWPEKLKTKKKRSVKQKKLLAKKLPKKLKKS